MTIIKGSCIGPGTTLPPQIFRAFKERALNTPRDIIDPYIQNVVESMNKIDGIATVWSCSGHYPDETDSEWPGRGYLVWVGDKNQIYQVDRFFQHLAFAEWGYNPSQDLLINQVSVTTLSPPPLEDYSQYGRYPVFNIEWDLENDRDRRVELEKLNKYIKSFR